MTIGEIMQTRLTDLDAELKKALKEEDFDKAAKLRDRIKELRSTVEVTIKERDA